MYPSAPRTMLALAALGLGLAATAAHAAPACPSSILNQPKGNQLFLYFAATSDNTFPSYHTDEIGTGATSPLAPFKVGDLDASIGTTAELRDRIIDLVRDDYCEFDVKVNGTTSMPSPSASQWQIMGIGSDAATLVDGSNLFGVAQDVDTNNKEPKDYSRVFASTFKNTYAGSGGPLNGSDSTLERWANAIGGTVSHEAAHNYGAAHPHSAPRPGSAEDGQNWHLMATGGTGLTGEMRASRDRHFSDTEYEILGHNVGLNTKTLHNWDFINPNDTKADRMVLKLLSASDDLSISWWYTGPSSPWKNPTVTYTGTTQSFQGKTYFVHDLEFAQSKSWLGPTPGVVQPAAIFHTGAGFAGDASVIVFDVQLFDGSSLLPLAPRLPGYDAGVVDMDSGDFALNVFNTDPGAGELILSEVLVFSSPRMLDIASMMRDARPVDVRGVPVELTARARFSRQELRERLRLPIGRLTDKRSVDILYGPDDCREGSAEAGTSERGRTGDSDGPGIDYCLQGNALSLFPATYTYLIATVVEPNARYWSPERGDFVNGPLQNIVYYQVGGIVPDFNRNGTDDLIDIRTGISRDGDLNGVPDEAQRGRR